MPGSLVEPKLEFTNNTTNASDYNNFQYEKYNINYSSEDLSKMISHDHTYIKIHVVPNITAKPPKCFSSDFNKPKQPFSNIKSNKFSSSKLSLINDFRCIINKFNLFLFSAEYSNNNKAIKSNKRLRKVPLKLREYVPVPIICLKKASPNRFNQSQHDIIEDELPLSTTVVNICHSFDSFHQIYNINNLSAIEAKPVKMFVNVGTQCN